MNEKIYIQRKYNKCLNILLAIYVVLCLVLSLLFNGFFIKTKAYTSSDNLTNFNVTITQNTPNNPNEHGSSVYTYSTNYENNQRGIFIYNEDINEYAENNISQRLWGEDIDCPLIFVYTDRSNGLVSEKTSSSGNIEPYINTMAFVLNEQEMTTAGFPQQFFYNWGCVGLYGIKDYGQSISPDDDFQYVTSYEDLKKYLVDNDNSVVKTGNPTKPVTTQDGNLPTPQKVNLWDSAQNCAGLIWENPKSINKYIKDLGDNVGIEIEWKPSLALTFGMLTVDSLTSSEWLPVYKGVISKSGSLINAFVSKKNDNARLDNNLNGYNYEIDDKYIFTPTVNDNDYLEQIAKNNHVRLWYANEDNVRGGSINESDVKNFKKNTFNDSNDLKSTKNVVGGEAESPVGEEGVNVAPSGISKLDLIQGIITGVGKVGKWIFDSFQIDTSNYRVRYYVKDGNNYSVSNWVDAKRGYDTNENAKEPTNVNFTDSNNNPVSNPSYLPSNQVTSSDSNSNSWWDRFYTENNNVLANLQTAFANFTADSGDFFGFFRALFTEFPEFYIFLCMGLGLAIMLRILGR